MTYCKKCKKEIPDGSLYCNYCGKKQVTTPRKAHKRAHGSGTIHIDKRYRKQYIAFAPAAYNGKRRYIGAYMTYADAQNAIDDYIRNGRPELYGATLKDIYERWSAAHYRTISEPTVKQYEYVWVKFAPLYNAKIADLRTPDFQQIIDTAKSASFANTIRALAKMICSYAVENDAVGKNYADFVKLPKSEKAEKVIFTSAQISELWEHTDDKRVQIILSMIYMGFRIGEIHGLTVDRVHLSDGYVIAGEKTDAGKDRIIPLPPNIPEISGFFARWIEEAEPGGRLFAGSISRFRDNIFYRPLVELGMISGTFTASGVSRLTKEPHLTPHSTRHTFASLSVAAGMQPENLQKIIGHANYTTTADIYVHTEAEQLRAEMAKLSR